MKKLTNTLIAIFSVLFFQNVCAQHVGTITKFEILPAYLTSDGKVKISNGSKTEVKYKVSFSRELSNTGAVGSYKPFNMTVMLSTPDANNEIVLFSPSIKVTSKDFSSKSAFLLDKEFDATIDNSKLKLGKPILLAYTIDDKSFPVYSYNDKLYNFLLPSTVPPKDSWLPADTLRLVPIYRKRWYTGGNTLRIDPNPQSGEQGLQLRDVAFRAYKEYGQEQRITGADLVYECIKIKGDPLNNTRYTYWNPMDPIWNEWKTSGNAFQAYTFQVPGSSAVYEYIKKSDGLYWYSTDYYPNDTRYTLIRIAFYAFAMPITRPGRGGNDGDRPGRDTTPPGNGVAGDRPPAGGGRPTRG